MSADSSHPNAGDTASPLPPPSRFSQLVWLGFAVVALALVGFWAMRVTALNNDLQRNLVPVSTVWGMHAAMIAMAAGIGGLALPLYRYVGRRRMLITLAVGVAGYLACGFAPRTNRIFFDEHIYMQIGQTIAHTGRAESANYARVEHGQFQMYSAITNKQPNGLPYLLSWLYRFFGISESVSHFLNRALTGLAAASLYLALGLVPWALPRGTGLAAAGLFIFTPLVLWWGHTVAVEPGAAATVVFAFLAACIHARLRDRASAQGHAASALLLAGATAFAIYFRPESMLVFPLVAALLWSTDDRFIEDWAAWGALALAIAIAMPNMLQIWSMRDENWGATDGKRFNMDLVGQNFDSNAGYFVNATWFPIVGTLFAVIGMFWLLGRNRTAGVTLGLWFAAAWGIFVMFYAGGYHYGASSRYGVVSAAPVAIFMGIGLAWLVGVLRRSPLIFAGLAAMGVVNWAAAFHYVPTLSREAVEAQADVDFVAEVSKKIPKGSIVISPDPCMWQLKDVNSSQFFVIENMVRNEMRELANQYPGGVYMHWSFWHNAEPHTAKESAQFLVDYDAQEIARTQSHAFKLALFRIDTPVALEKFGGPIRDPHRVTSDLDILTAAARARTSTPQPSASAMPEAPAAK